MSDAERLALLWEGGEWDDPEIGPVVLSYRTIGDLVLPSGRIITSDPFLCQSPPAFARAMLPGTYPIRVVIADIEETADQRVASAMLLVTDHLPVQWERAAHADGTVEPYGVDAGFAAFLDEAGLQALEAREDDSPTYLQQRVEEQDPHGSFGWAWLDATLDEDSRANLIAFTSGWGDGVYWAYWGLDADSNVACLMTDLGILTRQA